MLLTQLSVLNATPSRRNVAAGNRIAEKTNCAINYGSCFVGYLTATLFFYNEKPLYIKCHVTTLNPASNSQMAPKKFKWNPHAVATIKFKSVLKCKLSWSKCRYVTFFPPPHKMVGNTGNVSVHTIPFSYHSLINKIYKIMLILQPLMIPTLGRYF